MIRITYSDGTDHVLDFGMYPDGSFYLKKNEFFLDKDIDVITMIGVSPLDLYKLLSFVYARQLNSEYATGKKVFFPMMPGGRQDKIIDQDGVDYLATLSFNMNLIATLDSDFYTVDPHSLASNHRGIRFITQLQAIGANINVLKENRYDMVVAPDKGAAARAKAVADELDVPLLTLVKQRDPMSGNIFGYKEFSIGSAKALVVDDICDGGATFNAIAEASPFGPQMDLFTTFGIYSRGTQILQKNYEKIYTTDLYPSQSCGGVRVFNVLDRLIKEIANDTI